MQKALTAERLREVISYNADTGVFLNKVARRRALIGAVSGRINRDGYRQIQIDGRIYSAHRLAWLYVHGSWPGGFIDHINRLRSDNRLENLRLASRAENNQNSATPKTNTSGFRGVTWDGRGQKWRATITVDNKKISVGSHATPEEAYAAYLRAAVLLHSTNAAVADAANLL